MTMSNGGSRSERSWLGDWESRVLNAVRSEGYSDVADFARAHPNQTYEALANHLGHDIAPVHVEQVLRQLHLANGQITSFALDSIVRIIHEYLPNGWGRDEKSLVLAAQAFGAWSGGLGEEFDEQADIVWDRIENLEIPAGWLPDGPNDPILKEAFDGVVFAAN